MSYSLGCRLLLVVCGLLLVAEAAQADEAGRWRMPSTCAQYFGYGYGPGHQAPMIRSPGYRPHRVPRIVVIPGKDCPYCHAGYATRAGAAPADAWNCDALVMPGSRPSQGGCSTCGKQTALVQPTPAPQPAATAAPSVRNAGTPLFGGPQPPAKQYSAEKSAESFVSADNQALANGDEQLGEDELLEDEELLDEQETATKSAEEPAGESAPRPEAANLLDRSAMHIDGIQIWNAR